MAPQKAIDMVVAAIVGLKEKNGAGQEAILKYIAANNEVDIKKTGPHVRRAIKTGVASGKLVSTKKGLFKVPSSVASASIAKQAAKKAPTKSPKKIATVSHSKIVKQKPLTPKKAATVGGKKKGPVSSKPKTKKKGGGKKAGKKAQPKKAAGKKGGKK